MTKVGDILRYNNMVPYGWRGSLVIVVYIDKNEYLYLREINLMFVHNTALWKKEACDLP